MPILGIGRLLISPHRERSGLPSLPPAHGGGGASAMGPNGDGGAAHALEACTGS